MSFRYSSLAIALLLLSPPTMAQSTPGPPIPLGTGGVPGGLTEITMPDGGGSVRNVTAATLTPVLPAAGTANGAAVIIAPGGGFMTLSMEGEGFAVARWLADHGVAAFVLKYRLNPTPVDADAFKKTYRARLMGAVKIGADGLVSVNLPTPSYALEDGEAALRLVRADAAQWGIDRRRVGMMGFSAGAVTTLAVAQHSAPDTMPAFIAPIYGPMTAVPVPAGAPPMFTALAIDDPLFGQSGFGLVDSWHRAHRPVELHVYQNGGHGFGLGKPGTTTVSWIEGFLRWLDVNGFLKAPA